MCVYEWVWVCKKGTINYRQMSSSTRKTYVSVSSPRILNRMVTNFINFSLTLKFVLILVVFFFLSFSPFLCLSHSLYLYHSLSLAISLSFSRTLFLSMYLILQLNVENKKFYVLNENLNTIIMFSNKTPNHCLYLYALQGLLSYITCVSCGWNVVVVFRFPFFFSFRIVLFVVVVFFCLALFL